MKEPCVLAYSGGLDTSIIIPWLKENHGLEVHCVAGDVGQGDEELQGLLGNRAKVPVIITRLASARLFAAFCQTSVDRRQIHRTHDARI